MPDSVSSICHHCKLFLEIRLKNVVRARGLEPPILSEPDPKSGASAIPPRALWEKMTWKGSKLKKEAA
jgi:hypothetical protein